MLNEKTVSMIGFAKRAGKIAAGHDVVQASLKKKNAKLIMLCSDASQRLCEEFEKSAQGVNVPVIRLDVTQNEIYFLLGIRAAVIAVEDINFSNRIKQLIEQDINCN